MGIDKVGKILGSKIGLVSELKVGTSRVDLPDGQDDGQQLK